MAAENLAGKRVYVAGHAGMVGSALCRKLADKGCELVTIERGALDLRNQAAAEKFLRANKPEIVVVCAARVGGIEANRTLPASFLFDNLAIATNLINAAHNCDIDRLLFLGSSCMYPRAAEQPIREDTLLTGPLEPTNEWYALAKIAGLKLCQSYRRQYGRNYICAVPTNLYGPGDNFDPAAGHVVPALIRKTHEAKESGGAVEIWGTGTPQREFMYVDDAVDALKLLLAQYNGEEPINIAGGITVSIRDLASAVANCVGFEGGFRYDATKPDGMPRKSLSNARIDALGWTPKWSFEAGLRETYRWFRASLAG